MAGLFVGSSLRTEPELDRYPDPYGHGLAVVLSRMKTPLGEGLTDSVVKNSHWGGGIDMDFFHPAIAAHQYPDDHGALNAAASGCHGIGGVHVGEESGGDLHGSGIQGA